MLTVYEMAKAETRLARKIIKLRKFDKINNHNHDEEIRKMLKLREDLIIMIDKQTRIKDF